MTTVIQEQILVPATLDDTVSDLNELAGMISGDRWKTAAFVYAWTEPTSGGRPGKVDKNDHFLTLEGFAELGIRGLKTRVTVRKYRRAWEQAVQEGRTEAAEPGKRVRYPDKDFEDVSGLQSSNSNEWYTPSQYLEAAREVLGAFDLDPASSWTANQKVQAEEFFTEDDNALARDWHGRVWMNPPYGGLAGKFVAKLLEEFDENRVDSAIALLNAYTTDTDWFQPLWGHTLCYTDHRISYESADGPVAGSTHGDVFVYLGDDAKRFAERFEEFGTVVRRWPE